MRVTAKLAVSQIKKNRNRTFWTICAIVLSTALTTCVCSLSAGANAMLVSSLGADYGAYRGAYASILLISALLLGGIIFAMSVIVISNVFRISAEERIAQFGTLKCVGATSRQIMETVMYESLCLSAVGIPAGIVAGLCLTAVGTAVVNHFFSALNDLVYLMVKEVYFKLDFVLSWAALFVSAVVSFTTVLFSAFLPARRAAKTSAMESIRGIAGIRKLGDNSSRRAGKQKNMPLLQKLFGFEGVLAAKNIRRNRRHFKATVTALSIGIILFISLGSLGSQAEKLEHILYPEADDTVTVDYTSARITRMNEKTGQRESIYLRPIDSAFGDAVTKQLAAYDGKSVYGFGQDYETYDTVLPKECVSQEMATASNLQAQDSYTFDVELIVVDKVHYRELSKKAGVEEGAAILLNHFSYNDKGYVKHIVPFLPALERLVLYKADGSSLEIEIKGMLEKDAIPEELFYVNTNPVRLIVPEAVVRGYAWVNAPDDIAGYMDYANEVMAELFPEGEGASYMESGFSTTVFRSADYAKVMNIAIVLVAVLLSCFAVLLMLIGFTNVISTLSTNVLLRAREFAVLKSVGMTQEGLQRMLALESILCACRAIAFGVPIGLAMTYLINLPVRTLFPIPYELPLAPIIICSLAVLLITCMITKGALWKLHGQNIIEVIRLE